MSTISTRLGRPSIYVNLSIEKVKTKLIVLETTYKTMFCGLPTSKKQGSTQIPTDRVNIAIFEGELNTTTTPSYYIVVDALGNDVWKRPLP